jgi:hypothetical protein
VAVADRFLLEVANRRRLGADLTDAVVGIERGGSMETAQAFPSLTVTVDDPRDRLMQSNVLVRPAVRELGTAAAFALRPIDVLLDGVWYRLRGASRSGDTVALKFNHRGVVYMAQHDTPMSASRADMTRAQAIRRQVLEAGRKRGAGHRLAFWAYELRRRMPLAPKGEETSSRSEPDRDVADTSLKADGARGLKIKGRAMNAEQRRNVATSLGVAEDLDAPRKAVIAMLCAGIGESEFRVVMNRGGSDYGGVFQGNVKGGVFEIGDTAGMARCFLKGGKGFQGGGAIALSRQAGLTPGEIALKVEGSRSNFATQEQAVAHYQGHKREAEAILAGMGGEGGDAEDSGSYTKAFRFRRPRGEDGWTNTGKLAEEVKKRRFVTIPQRGSDLFVYAADRDLLRLRSQATIDLDAGYVKDPEEYDLDYGKTVRGLRLTVTGDPFDMDFAWGLPVTLDGGPGGKWIVWEVHEVDGSPVVELDLRQPQAAAPEPRSETVQRADTSDSPAEGLPSLDGTLSGTPKAIIDRYVLPVARKHDMKTGITAAGVEAANGAHSVMTTSGNRSAHKGPPEVAWAADMSNGTAPTPQMDALAQELADLFGMRQLSMSVTGRGGSTQISNAARDGYSFQLIYRSKTGGNHDNHVHFGCKRG